MTHITIPASTDPRQSFVVGGTPSDGPFSFTFPFFATSDLDVYVVEDAGATVTLLTETTEYVVTPNTTFEGGFAGGDIDLVTAVQDCEVWVVYNPPIYRTDDFPESGRFNIRTLNTTLDRFASLLQVLRGMLGRVPILSSWLDLDELVLPPPGAGEYLRWNVAGTQLETAAIVAESSVVTASETVQGIVELATQAEVNAGVDDQRAVTSLKLQTRLAALVATGAYMWVGRDILDTPGSGTYDTQGADMLHGRGVGGGGGGGAAQGTIGETAAGAGGSAGSYIEFIIEAPDAEYDYVVGAFGAGGTTPANNGSDGGLTQLEEQAPGTLVWTANGGPGGLGDSGGTQLAPIPGGGTSDGSSNAAAGTWWQSEGQEGQPGIRISAARGLGGSGGPSMLGAGARAQAGVSAAGWGSSSFGGGGGGATSTDVTDDRAGGDGGNGVLIIDRYKLLQA